MNEKIIQLEQQLQSAHGTARIDLLNELAWELQTIQERALDLAAEAIALSKEIGYEKGQAYSLRTQAFCYYSSGHYDLAKRLIMEAMPYAERENDHTLQIQLLNTLADAHRRLAEFSSALEIGFKALKMCQQENDNYIEAFVLISIGLVYMSLLDETKALEYMLEALDKCQKTGNMHGESITVNNLGKIYTTLEKYDDALKYYERGLEICRHVGNRYGEVFALNDMGRIHLKLNQYDLALAQFQLGLTLAKQVGHKHNQMVALIGLGECYLLSQTSFRDLDKAASHLTNALELAEKIQDKEEIHRAHYLLASLYQEVNQPQQALYHYQQYHHYQSILFAERSNRQLTNVQIQHHTDQTRQALDNLRNQYHQMEEDYQRLKSFLNELLPRQIWQYFRELSDTDPQRYQKLKTLFSRTATFLKKAAQLDISELNALIKTITPTLNATLKRAKQKTTRHKSS